MVKIVIFIEAFDNYGIYEININTENYMHIVFISKNFKFKDDFEILIDAENKVLQYRSESRFGYSDMGVNMDIYNKISRLYKQRLEILKK